MSSIQDTTETRPSSMTNRLRRWVENPRTGRFIMGLIIVNAAILGLETSQSVMDAVGPILLTADKIILGIFILEIAARIIVHGRRFWTDPWSLFDFSVVAIALIPATGNLSVLRALRVVRALRLISAIKSMRRVVDGLLNAIPGMGSIVALLLLVFYVFSVMATKLFGADFPQWFGSIGESAYSLFQIMTLESWSMGIVRPVMELHGWAWAFFVPFILLTSFTVLNLFIGIIVDAMQRQHEAEMEAEYEDTKADLAKLLKEVRLLREEVKHLSGTKGM